jgi:catechol 2,3-dioxygenase-like lactoylglutathione lyase family enzyme
MNPRLDHIVIVVDDLKSAIAFFTELGLTTENQMPVEGKWVDRVNNIDGVRVDIVMMVTPDGHGKVELTKFHSPKAIAAKRTPAPPNTYGYRSIMFEVDDIDGTVGRLRARGNELVGEIVNYENVYRLCYVHGPEGVIVALAQSLS